MKKLSTKIWGIITLFLVLTILFMYVLTDYLYEQLYVEDTQTSLIEVGEKLRTQYQGGKVTDDFIAEVENFNAYSNFDVFAVRNPRELSACVPFEIDYDALIGPEERQQLLQGESVTNIGYEQRFERQIISVILPLTDQNRLEGILYMYYPLAKISELANQEALFLICCAILFSCVLGFFVYKGIRHIMQPLNELQHAVEQMSDGDYKARVPVSTKDEIGKLSEAFNEMAAAIEHEDEAQKNFLATVSHELRTPISYVKGYSEAISQNFIGEKEKQEAMKVIAREANRMEQLTNELLELARTSNEQQIELYPIVLAETVREVIHLLNSKATNKKIHITTMLEEQIIVLGNEEKLKQIVINVIENAIHYSNEGSNVSILTKITKGNAVLEIADTGIGIPANDLPHITERFYRVNKARSRADGGSGLGLAIVEKLVKMHKGNLTITSEVGIGTTVCVTIPLMEE
ncbi:sensor histidine kinase [Lysinibacillus antri]|uniref:histidine kinase n=1 Tax=Lysinibacillus antri TaxID=2498145 RepID=A0A3S0PM81_9BACI|nr:ATP-binding protein [Lysinibacillus antri]RUL47483.1 HAMP domain-containing sensor histidine kinase [Lysinibacillus antri]